MTADNSLIDRCSRRRAPEAKFLMRTFDSFPHRRADLPRKYELERARRLPANYSIDLRN